MGKLKKAGGLVIFLLALFFSTVAAQDYVIESRLFKGSPQRTERGAEVVVSAYSEPVRMPFARDSIATETRHILDLENELSAIYQLESVDHVASSYIIWNGKKESFTESILLEDFLLPIRLSPEKVSKNRVNLRVEISGLAGPEDQSSSVRAGEPLLATEIVMNQGEPVVLGFPSDGQRYFLSLLITKEGKRKAAQTVKLAGRSTIEIFAVPTAVRSVKPPYPQSCQEARIQGTVVLRVTTGTGGDITQVDVVKSVHPELDRAAAEALRQWKYEPVLRNGKPVSVIFAVSVDFKLRNKEAKRVMQKPAETPSTRSAELEKILKNCAAYGQKLKAAALFFVCEEKIQEEIYNYATLLAPVVSMVQEGQVSTYETALRPRSVEKNTYLYDYQLIQKEGKIQEQRMLLEENGEKRSEKNAPLKTKRFYSERSIFGPVGLLSREWQPFYNYTLLKEEKVGGRETYVIEVKPKIRLPDKPNYGKVWVDKKDSAILRLDVEDESLPGFERILKESKSQKLKPLLTITHEYGVEKNGILFPSRTVFHEDYSSFRTKKFKKSQTTIIYTNYRFFTVETDVEY